MRARIRRPLTNFMKPTSNVEKSVGCYTLEMGILTRLHAISMILSGSRVRWDSVRRTFWADESVGILFHTLQPVGENVAFAPADSCVFIQMPMISASERCP